MTHFFESLPFAVLTRALSWTFVHSLWQGLAAALLAALVIRCTRTARPQTRYRLFGTLLLLFAGAAAATFIRELGHPADGVITGGLKAAGAGAAISAGQATAVSAVAGIGYHLSFLLDQWSGLVAGGWFAVCWYKSIRLMSSLNGTRLLRTRGVSLPEDRWMRLVQRLSVTLQVRRRVLLLESVLVDMPVVIGYFKPVLLVPAGLLTGLPPAQVEAVLLHELAHIRRHDYLVNGLQRVLELLFHFNPFLLWLSARLRQEREACCDGVAVSVTGNKEAFVGALISFGERQLRLSRLALPFATSGQQLLDRVERIAYNRNHGLGRAESVLAGISLLLLVTAAFAFSGTVTPPRIRPVAAALVKTITIATSNLPADQDSVKVAAAIEADLVGLGVVRREDLISFRLDGEELLVNGVRQPADLQRRLSGKYLTVREARIEYRKQTAAEGAAA